MARRARLQERRSFVPDHVWESICTQYLSPSDVIAFSLACKNLKAIAYSEGVWREKCLQHFPSLKSVELRSNVDYRRLFSACCSSFQLCHAPAGHTSGINSSMLVLDISIRGDIVLSVAHPLEKCKSQKKHVTLAATTAATDAAMVLEDVEQCGIAHFLEENMTLTCSILEASHLLAPIFALKNHFTYAIEATDSTFITVLCHQVARSVMEEESSFSFRLLELFMRVEHQAGKKKALKLERVQVSVSDPFKRCGAQLSLEELMTTLRWQDIRTEESPATSA